MIVIVRAVQTSIACPAQWDAWGDDGKYYYLRYRHGVGYMQHWPSGPEFWERFDEQPELVGHFEYGDELDGSMGLAEFAERTGFRLCQNLDYKHYGQYLADALKEALQEKSGDEEEVQL